MQEVVNEVLSLTAAGLDLNLASPGSEEPSVDEDVPLLNIEEGILELDEEEK